MNIYYAEVLLFGYAAVPIMERGSSAPARPALPRTTLSSRSASSTSTCQSMFLLRFTLHYYVN